MSVIALTHTSLHTSNKRQIKLRVSDPALLNNYLESAALIYKLSREKERFSSLTSHPSQWLFRADFKVQRRKNQFNQQEANKFCQSNKTRWQISDYNYLTYRYWLIIIFCLAHRHGSFQTQFRAYSDEKSQESFGTPSLSLGRQFSHQPQQSRPA